MSNVKHSIANRLFAVILALVMVVGMLPTTALRAEAVEVKWISITVKDGEGNPIEGAAIQATLTESDGTTPVFSGGFVTNAEGIAKIHTYSVDGQLLSATITAEGYQDASLAASTVDAEHLNFDVVMTATQTPQPPQTPKIEDVTIVAKSNLVYTGVAQDLVSVTEVEGDVITYEVDGGTASDKAQGVDAKSYSVKVTVKRTGYEDLVETVTATIAPAKITGISIEGKIIPYKNESKEIVTLIGEFEENDIVTWTVNTVDTGSRDIPTEIAVGTYNVTLTVKRENYETFTDTVVTFINDQIDLEGLKVTGLEGEYKVDENGDAKEQWAVEVENEKNDYTLYYQLRTDTQDPDVNAWQTERPKVSAAGKYIVWVKAVKTGYNDTNVPVEASASLAPYNVYIAKAEVNKPAEDDTVFTYNTQQQTYVVDANDLYVVENNVHTDANTYKVKISLSDPNNYQWKDGDSEPLEYDFVINKAAQEIKFAANAKVNERISGSKEFLLTECFPVDIVKGGSGNTVKYSIISSDPAGIATIDEVTGMLVVTDAGKIKIRASLEGNDNYLNAEDVEHSFTVKEYGSDAYKLLWYENNTYTYTFGTQNGKNIEQAASFAPNTWVKYYTDYKVDSTIAGLSFNVETGKFEITDYKELADAIIEGKNTVQVTAYIPEGNMFYEPCEASYTFIVEFAQVNNDSFTVAEPSGKIPAHANNTEATTGWYVDDDGVKITATSNYSVGKEAGEKAPSILLTEQGTAAKYFYVTDNSPENAGAIARVELTDIKYDSEEPSDVTITFDPAIDDSFVDNHYFQSTDMKIVFTAKDQTSGIKYFDWEYHNDGYSISTLPTTSGRLEAELVNSQTGEYKATLTLPLSQNEVDQLRGVFIVTAVDAAGNTTRKDDDGRIIIVDTINPDVTIEHTWSDTTKEEKDVYEKVTENGVVHHYYNDSVVYTIKITEANFFMDSIAKQVSIKVNGEDWTAKANWTRAKVENTEIYSDTYYGTFTIPDDGDYVVTIEYTDYSGKGMLGENIQNAKYTSEKITIDTADPVITFVDAPANQQYVKIKVTEHNFLASKITLDVAARDLADDLTVDEAKILAYLQTQNNWKQTGDSDEWEITLEAPVLSDAIYILTVGYEGYADDDAAPKATDEFTVDHTAPDASKIAIEYADATFIDKVLNTITLGFYKPNVTVTFTAYDITSGIKEFNWSYTRATGASDTNLEVDSDTLTAIPVSGTPGLYKAELVLPRSQAVQLRGNITVDVVDICGNGGEDSKKVDDLNIVIIDTIAPEISVGYNAPANTVGDKAYYNGDVAVEITVKEANFFAEDVIVKVSKNGAAAEAVTPSWSDETVDVHKGTFTIKGDGHYIVSIEYTDKSDNFDAAKSSYTSHEITIDETAPVINVAYINNSAANDKYFNAGRTATITITEHNFDKDKVIFTQNAARGGVVPNVSWSSSGDTHTATFVYSKDGDYTFDVTMTDLATNASAAANFGNSVAGKDFVIDTTFEDMISQSGVETGVAYGHDAEVVPNIKISDINLDEYTITLTGVQKDTTIDLSKDVNALLKKNTETVTGVFDVFEVVQNLDGIYTLKMTSKDKAGNEDSMEIVFTVNRFGSVYVFEDYLLNLVKDNGAFVQEVDSDLVITEFNADRLVADSLKIEITVDGKPLENVQYTVTPEINDTVSVGSSGWYQYKYTISKDNFAADGVYKISISSEDATGNTPENSNYEDKGMTFRVDRTQAEISSVVGLEEAIINAQEVTVKYTVFDTIGIKSIMVYVDGKPVNEITDFTADPNNYSGSFTLAESSSAQAVRIVVEDMAGNITDTNAEDFAPAYEFNGSVTVSTNIFVRWYANKPLFWGSIGGVVVVAGALWFFLAGKKKKKEEATAK